MNEPEQRIARLEKTILFNSKFAIYPELKKAIANINEIVEELELLKEELAQERKPKGLSKVTITGWIATFLGLVTAIFGGTLQLELFALKLQQDILYEVQQFLRNDLACSIPTKSDNLPVNPLRK